MRSLSFRMTVAVFFASPLVLAAGLARGQAPQQAPASAPAEARPRVSIHETYPNRIRARLEQHNRSLSHVTTPSSGLHPAFAIHITKRWNPGQTVKIAFRGGDKVVHKKIADTVSEWTHYANLNFDFGVDPSTGQYRTWKRTDTAYAADIRVSFDQDGYYSLVGTDSVTPSISKPGEESLNLQQFDQSLPFDWKAVAQHEFGHAIGFEHEHQGPAAMCDFRFEDDPGYTPTTDNFGQFVTDPSGKRPGLYTLLGGPPNNWPQEVVDFNLKKLPASSAIIAGPFDKLSIMKYFFEADFFASGTMSPCYTDTENLVISAQDQAGAAKVYPRSAAAIAADVTLREKVLTDITKAQAMPAALKQHYENSLRALRNR